jgi:hypothetical protein
MTSDGVDGTADDSQPATGRGDGRPGPVLINRDDGLLASRYIEPAYPHTPAGAAPTVPGASCKWHLPCVTTPIF